MGRKRFTDASYPAYSSDTERPSVTTEELDRAAAAPVLKIENLNSPVIIESIKLLRKRGEYFVHVRSKDGAEGISVTNSRAGYLHPILKQMVVPYFINLI